MASYPADPAKTVEASEYRTTWIVSSLEGVRSTGAFERYREALRRIDRESVPGAEEAVLTAVANAWMPMHFARAHYQAGDTLGLSEDEVLAAMLTADGGQVRRTWHAQIIAAAQRPEAAPWILLPQLPKLWPRTAVGGGLFVYRRGPTQARVEYRGFPLVDVGFYRDAARAVLHSFAANFCRGLSVVSMPGRETGHASFTLSWR